MAAGRLSDELGRRFGDEHVFMDVDKIEPGVDFTEAINKAVGSCDVLIAIIGPQWLTRCDARGRRRLDAPEDYVRLEIEAALKRNVRVIPALVEGALMPASDDLPPELSELATRNCIQLGDGVRWRYDVEGLIRALERMRAAAGAEPVAEPPAPVETQSRGATAARAVPRRLSTRRRWLLALAGAALVAAAVLGIVLTRGTTGASSGAGMGGSPMHTGFPDAIEHDLLLAHVPSGIRRSCRRAPLIASAVFLRTVKCSQQGGGLVTYSRAHSAPALVAYFQHRVNAAGLNYPTKSSCSGGTRAADEWRREGTQTHLEQRSSQAQGRVLCYPSASTSWIAWTDNPTKIFAEAFRPSAGRQNLYSWWRNAAGPEAELAMSAGMGQMTWQYPDAIEKELLLDHIPPAIRKTCHRSNAFDEDVFLRAVQCSQGVPGATVKYMYAHSAIALKGYSTDQITAAGLQLGNGRSCANGSDGADKWFLKDDIVHIERPGNRAGGRVLCIAAAGQERIDWTDNPTGIYATASRPAGQRRALYAWWRDKAGPGALEMTSMMGG
jgi:TIR domain